jgi:uncharacterized membrane protein YqhA
VIEDSAVLHRDFGSEKDDSMKHRGYAEAIFEYILFNSRMIVMLAVLGSLAASIIMFVQGALQIYQACAAFIHNPMPSHGEGHADLTVLLIASVDTFLFATVLLIFSMGIYELFISKIDPASRTDESRPNWLAIHSLDDLKSALGKVILMILIVRLFEAAAGMKYENPLDLVYLGVSLLFVSVALYLVHAGQGHAKPPTYKPSLESAQEPEAALPKH